MDFYKVRSLTVVVLTLAENGRFARTMPEQKKKKILMVEDEPSILEATTIVLREKYDVTSVQRGDEALRLFKEREFDLVVSDVRMPGLNGLNLFQEIKKLKQDQKFIFISVSSLFYQDEEAQQIIYKHSDGFLGKPYRIADLYALVEKVIV